MQPTTPADFDRAYSKAFTFWGDVRVPAEIKDLVAGGAKTSLELGCGLGRFSQYVAQQGVRAVAVDFSAVAIERAKERTALDAVRAEYLVGDVTNLENVNGPFDVAFDVGCFHCLDAEAQRAYVAEMTRLVRGKVLIWAIDDSPSNMTLGPGVVKEIFADSFDLVRAEKSRRRIIASHWYWLERR